MRKLLVVLIVLTFFTAQTHVVYSEKLYEGEDSKLVETKFNVWIPNASGTIRCIKE